MMPYRAVRTDLDSLVRFDRFWSDSDAALAALDSDDWSEQQAALLALADTGGPDATERITAVLDAQETLDLYGAPEEYSFEGATDTAQHETWRCRFRVKQAACLALGGIGARHGVDAVGDAGVERLCALARSQEDDYTVRAAACKALGMFRPESARATLEAATEDTEFCTNRHARQALVKYDGG